MTINVSILPIPNQRFGIRLDGDRYEIELKSCNNIMCVTILRNDILLVSGFRCVAGTPLLPYRYLERGNFIFVTENDELPDYTKFGSTQSLVYITAQEIANARD